MLRFKNEFHFQIDNRGDYPNTDGLHQTIRLPAGSNIVKDTTEAVYEWRLEDGREQLVDVHMASSDYLPVGQPVTYQNEGDLYVVCPGATREPFSLQKMSGGNAPIIQANRFDVTPVLGPILRKSLVRMTYGPALDRHVASFEKVLDIYVPDKNFKGMVCMDYEMWQPYQNLEEVPDYEILDGAIASPTFTRAELFSALLGVTNTAVKKFRPHARGIGWYGVGGVHPGFLLWKENFFADSVRAAIRDGHYIRNAGTAMPVFYYFWMLPTRSERDLAFKRLVQVYEAGWGVTRLRSGLAYINCRHGDASNPKCGQWFSFDETLELVGRCTAAGFTKFIVWEALESASKRDELQMWIDSIFIPVVRKLGLYEGKAPAGGAA